MLTQYWGAGRMWNEGLLGQFRVSGGLSQGQWMGRGAMIWHLCQILIPFLGRLGQPRATWFCANSWGGTDLSSLPIAAHDRIGLSISKSTFSLVSGFTQNSWETSQYGQKWMSTMPWLQSCQPYFQIWQTTSVLRLWWRTENWRRLTTKGYSY